ncbi:MAG: hypothetical protein WBM44_16720 [Waterburya sp.]
MAHRIIKKSVGVYKQELRNEPMKFLVSSYEAALINSQCQNYVNCSEYLRELILKKQRRIKKNNHKTKSLTDIVDKIGRQLNKTTKQANISLLNGEIIDFNYDNLLFNQIVEALNIVKNKSETIISQKNQTRNIQVKFLVTPTELKQIKKKIKRKKIKFSSYMRQQITGYDEKEHKNKAIEISRAISKLANNINQLLNAIRVQERTKGIALINPELKQSIILISQTITELQLKLR